MSDKNKKIFNWPTLAADAIVLRKHKTDEYHDILLVTRGHPPDGCLRELKEETELDGKDIELLTVRGKPDRDPRRHVVTIVYIVNVDPDSKPKGGDDAKDAKFYDLKNIIEKEKDNMSFDHYSIIEELVEKKLKGLYKLYK